MKEKNLLKNLFFVSLSKLNFFFKVLKNREEKRSKCCLNIIIIKWSFIWFLFVNWNFNWRILERISFM